MSDLSVNPGTECDAAYPAKKAKKWLNIIVIYQ